jgi:cysteine desulfurase
MKGIYTSSGSACTSQSLEPSHVLAAMGLDIVLAHSSLRFTLGRQNTKEDIDYFFEVFAPALERLRSISVL